MRILLVNYRYFISGGPEKYMFNIKKMLEDNGHEVIPFSIHSNKNVETEYSKYFVEPIGSRDATYFEECKKTPKVIWQMLTRSIYSTEVEKAIKKEIKDVKPDLVYMPYAPVDILIWPISVIVYYNYSYYYDITKIAQNKAIWFFFAMCAIAVPLIKIHLSGAGNIGQVIFLTYFCITTLPLVLILTNNRSCRNLCVVLTVLISTASTKRAGTLALILGLFVMFVVEAHIQGTLNQRWKKYLKIMLLILIGTIMVFYLESTGRIQILDRFARLGDDGGSGRDVIWSIVLNAYHSSGLVQRLFGHGFQSVYYILRPGGFYRFAHNSYIEYLYDYGTVGLILLLVFIIALIVSTIDMVRRKARFAPVMCLLLVISVFLGMFSYFFEESNIIMPVAVAYGVILGLDKKEKNIKDEI